MKDEETQSHLDVHKYLSIMEKRNDLEREELRHCMLKRDTFQHQRIFLYGYKIEDNCFRV